MRVTIRKASYFLTLAFVAISITPRLESQSPKSPVVIFRSPFTMKLRIDKDHYYERAFDKVPYVSDGDVYLFIGEDFGVNVVVAKDKITGLTYQPDVSKADVTFRFTQEKSGDGYMTMLTTENKLSSKLYIDGLMTVPQEKGVLKTSLLPIGAKLVNFESWPHPIVQLVLRNFRLSDKENTPTQWH